LSNPFAVLDKNIDEDDDDIKSDINSDIESDIDFNNYVPNNEKNANLLESKCQCSTYQLTIKDEQKYLELQTAIHKYNLHLRWDSRLVSNYFEGDTNLTLEEVVDLLVETHLIYDHTLYKQLRPALCGYSLKDEKYAENILQQTLLRVWKAKLSNVTGTEKLCYCGKPYVY